MSENVSETQNLESSVTEQLETQSADVTSAEASTTETSTPDSSSSEQSLNLHDKGNKTRTVIIVVAACVVVALIGALVLGLQGGKKEEAAKPTAKPVAEQPVEPAGIPELTPEIATAKLTQAGIVFPDLSGYHYLTLDNMTGPSFDNIVITDPESTEATPNPQSSVRLITANATFANGFISVVMPVSERMVFDAATNDWVSENVEVGPYTVTPLAAPVADLINADFPRLLDIYNHDLAVQFEGSTNVFTPSLADHGGNIIVMMHKEVPEMNQALDCQVVMQVTWSNTEGWVPNIVLSTAPSVNALNSGAAVPQEDIKFDDVSSPSLLLTCKSGDIVELVGTVEDTGRHTMFRTDEVMRIRIDGVTQDTNLFELIINDPNITIPINAHVTMQAVISTGGTLEGVPFVLTLDRFV